MRFHYNGGFVLSQPLITKKPNLIGFYAILLLFKLLPPSNLV